MTEHIDIVVFSSPDSEQHPITEKTRRKKKPASKANVQYYGLKHKGAYTCQHCERIYTCKSSLVKHQGRSIKGFLERRIIFDEIKRTPAEEFNPEKILAKMETMIPTK